MVVRVLRRVSAWALPRPSATDSARLAKITVNHSHPATIHTKEPGTGVPLEVCGSPMTISMIARIVVRTAPTHTRAMTGLWN